MCNGSLLFPNDYAPLSDEYFVLGLTLGFLPFTRARSLGVERPIHLTEIYPEVLSKSGAGR